MPNEISKLAKYGTSGICIALIIAIIITVRLLYSFATEKMKDNTEVIRESIRVQQRLIDTVKRLDDTISKPEAQLKLWSSVNGNYEIVDELFPVELNPSMTPATTTE